MFAEVAVQETQRCAKQTTRRGSYSRFLWYSTAQDDAVHRMLRTAEEYCGCVCGEERTGEPNFVQACDGRLLGLGLNVSFNVVVDTYLDKIPWLVS